MPEPERIGPYRLIRLLGAGGMGEVFLAHDERLDRLVAIKRLRTSSEVSPERRKRFRREARIAARLEHPNIVQIHDVLSEGEVDCIVMEYVDGQDLRQRSKDARPSLHETLAIAGQIALAMAEAHDREIIHRDLKTENVLITRTGQVKITDFGIAKDLRDETLTGDGHLMGTSRSMSPEQASARPVDHRSDLFSFGTLLYEILTGKSPFLGETSYLTMHRVVNDAPESLHTLVPGLPPALVALIEQLLAKEPLLRPRSFREVAQILAQLQGLPCTGTPPAGRSPPGNDGDTAATEDPEPAPDDAAARSPGVRLAGRTPSDMVETESMPPTVAPAPVAPAPAPSVPHAPAPPAPPAARTEAAQNDEPGDQGNAMASSMPPLRRARWRRAVIMAITGAALALGLGYWLWTGIARQPGHRYTYVAVPGPIEAPAGPGAALTAAAVRGGLARGLSEREDVVVLPLHDVTTVSEGFLHVKQRQPTADEMMRAMGADELIESRLTCGAQECVVSWKRIARDGGIRATTEFAIRPDDAIAAEQAVLEHLRALYRDHGLRKGLDQAPLTPADQVAYLGLRSTHWAHEGTSASDEMLAQLELIRRRSPAAVHVYRLEIDMLRRRYRHSARDADLARILVLIREAERQAPDSYEILATQFDFALEADLTDLARDTLRRIEALDPASGWTLLLRGRWHAEIGEKDEALAVLQRAATPGSYWRIRYHLAAMRRERDELDEARRHIDRLLEQSPGNYAGLSWLASVEMRSNNPACAVELYDALVERHRYYDECNGRGVAEMLLGRYEGAAASFRCSLEARLGDPLASLNLAEALALAGDTQAASTTFGALLESLRASEPLRTGDALELETLALAHQARHGAAQADEARLLMDRVLAETAGQLSHEILYTAATVHALLGDDADSVKYVRQLLDGGRLPSWFRFPWFDAVRNDPALQQRLAENLPAPTCKH
jgi:serine/threonine protein kinase/tetratricopeptide (TPR) repeat protein